jgi:hypothetical protein
MNGLTVLGQSVPNALSDFNTRGGPSFYNNQLPRLWWDPTVVVPGEPLGAWSWYFAGIPALAKPGRIG